jgi:hypothetical protein
MLAALYSQKYLLVLPEGSGKLKELIDLIGTRTYDLPACSIASQPFALPHAPVLILRVLLRLQMVYILYYIILRGLFPHPRSSPVLNLSKIKELNE